MPDPKNNNKKLILENQLIEKYTITSLIFDQETAVFSYDFPIQKVFDTFDEARDEIVLSLEFEPNVWHTVCPLYLPNEMKNETSLSQCLSFDAVVKEKVFQKQIKGEVSHVQVLPIEDVYRENGTDFPENDSETKGFIKPT